jgi:hypothetical protein
MFLFSKSTLLSCISQNLLGIDPQTSARFEAALLDKQEYLRPGFSRLSLPYFMPDREVEYVLAAVRHIANEGWRLLPQYKFNYKTGEWKHRSRFTKFPERKWLGHLSLEALAQQQQQQPVACASSSERRTWTHYYGRAKTATGTDPNQRVAMAAAVAAGGTSDLSVGSDTASGGKLSTEQIFAWCESEAMRLTAEAELAKHLLPSEAEMMSEFMVAEQSAGASEVEGEGGSSSHVGLRWMMLPHEVVQVLQQERGRGGKGKGTSMQTGPPMPPALSIEPRVYNNGDVLSFSPGDSCGARSAICDGSNNGSTSISKASTTGTAEAAAPKLPARPKNLQQGIAVSSDAQDPLSDKVNQSASKKKEKYPSRSSATSRPIPPSFVALSETRGVVGIVSTSDTKLKAGEVQGKEPKNESSSSGKRNKSASDANMGGPPLWPKPPSKLMRTVGQAIAEWSMIEEGDRVLLGLVRSIPPCMNIHTRHLLFDTLTLCAI